VRGGIGHESASLPREEFVNGEDLIDGGNRIHDTLRSEGYLDAAVTLDRTIDDAAQSVDVLYNVSPGALYRFGRLEILGIGLDGEAAIRKMWSVKPGDPFPGGYPDYFVKAVKDEGLFDNLGGITATPSINAQTHVVDVRLNFAGTPAARRQF
jgi:outer membrane protein assembly factor BamA